METTPIESDFGEARRVPFVRSSPFHPPGYMTAVMLPWSET